MVLRTLGEKISISVGTAIPIEKLLETGSKGIGTLYLNVATLFRNFYGAIEDPDKVNKKDLVVAFVDELNQLYSIVLESVPGNIVPIFYNTSGKSLDNVFKHCSLKKPTTQAQRDYSNLQTYVINETVKLLGGIIVEEYDLLINGRNNISYIITSYPLDLLSYPKFRNLQLLESHTGNIKERKEWIHKLTSNEKYFNIPFNILSIQVLGDKSKWFNSMGRKYTSMLLNLAIKNKWHALTTTDKIVFDLDRDVNMSRVDKMELNMLLNTKLK
jgi:hypothetical protein